MAFSGYFEGHFAVPRVITATDLKLKNVAIHALYGKTVSGKSTHLCRLLKNRENCLHQNRFKPGKFILCSAVEQTCFQETLASFQKQGFTCETFDRFPGEQLVASDYFSPNTTSYFVLDDLITTINTKEEAAHFLRLIQVLHHHFEVNIFITIHSVVARHNGILNSLFQCIKENVDYVWLFKTPNPYHVCSILAADFLSKGNTQTLYIAWLLASQHSQFPHILLNLTDAQIGTVQVSSGLAIDAPLEQMYMYGRQHNG